MLDSRTQSKANGGLKGITACPLKTMTKRGWLVGWLASFFIQGKPLASGYYSRHPETMQYNKNKDKDKRKKIQTQEKIQYLAKKTNNEENGHASELK